mmetsp:Transcript_31755/g.28845  ORF Transcript_31755/g.28845 Transcript_31755/m.28845 type:complete len:133 (-) Transcript_31755:24-422(-)
MNSNFNNDFTDKHTSKYSAFKYFDDYKEQKKLSETNQVLSQYGDPTKSDSRHTSSQYQSNYDRVGNSSQTTNDSYTRKQQDDSNSYDRKRRSEMQEMDRKAQGNSSSNQGFSYESKAKSGDQERGYSMDDPE